MSCLVRPCPSVDGASSHNHGAGAAGPRVATVPRPASAGKGTSMRRSFALFCLCGIALAAPTAALQRAARTTDPARQAMLQHLDAITPELVAINQDIWGYAEVGLEEHRSSKRLADALERGGFRVRRSVSGMPTAFVAEYGSGKPVIGLLAEYDALPELSQE